MTLLDTNILIRFFTNDALDQATYARQIFALAKPGELVITDAVLSEFCFVLQFNKLYLFERPFINDAWKCLSNNTPLVSRRQLEKAISYFQANPKLDFVDCPLDRSGSYTESSRRIVLINACSKLLPPKKPSLPPWYRFA